ncbi:hypothetical protein MiTs_00362 [Microcystis aeruginosa NIES-2521]|uniref:Uncharacterized protein n=1 Tax=Microcystis aeruginosa NIES-2521 TaxID=2303983 RepID=A0A5A5RPA9_MICAE|nr:hypothetical protein MiTs_00362 [Microcystis aeruginosa NIES-2521]
MALTVLSCHFTDYYLLFTDYCLLITEKSIHDAR